MFCGKTTELFSRLNRAKHSEMSCVLYKYSKDVRYAAVGLASSHDRITQDAIPVQTLLNMEVPDDCDVIGIDEGQLIEGGVVEFALDAAAKGKRVIISALNSDFRMMPWPTVQSLIPICERLHMLHAVCYRCRKKASFTKRIDGTNQDQCEIGGADKYVASCRLCFDCQIR
jgi:thymidine kinase